MANEYKNWTTEQLKRVDLSEELLMFANMMKNPETEEIGKAGFDKCCEIAKEIKAELERRHYM